VRPLLRCQGRRRSVRAVVQVLRLLSRCDVAVEVLRLLSRCDAAVEVSRLLSNC
jgi:hypothetical protein